MWFKDTIQQALNKSEDEKIMLLTFINGSNEESIKMNSILDDPNFKTEINDSLVALKFDEKSENAEMFKAIYPYESAPTVYLISSDAKVLDKLVGFIEKNDLINKINSALSVQQTLKLSINQTTSTNTVQLTEAELKEKEKKTQELIKDIRAKKAKENEEKEKELEKNRIRTGKEIQTAKEIQRQKEMEEIVRQRALERKEEQAARQRVLEQIRQDQEDRKARNNQVVTKPKPLIISQPKTITSDETRIQLRLPDSSIIKDVFKINDPLRTVIKYVEDKTSYRNFKLIQNFPKIQFEDADLDKTLVDLKLIPSAVLVVRVPPVQIQTDFDY